jgi:hypothetical protein
MPPVALFTVRLRNGLQFTISNVADAANALADPRWPGKGSALYKDAVRLTDEALAGHCKAAVALEAFRKAASDTDILSNVNTSKN